MLASGRPPRSRAIGVFKGSMSIKDEDTLPRQTTPSPHKCRLNVAPALLAQDGCNRLEELWRPLGTARTTSLAYLDNDKLLIRVDEENAA